MVRRLNKDKFNASFYSSEVPVKYLMDKILVWLLINAKQILYWR